MTDTATPETGPVDAPASDEGSVADRMAAQLVSEIESGSGEEPEHGNIDAIVQEMVNEAEGDSGEPSTEEPAAEDDATDPAEQAQEPEEGTPESDEQLVTVKVNGEERQVPLSEALAGYSRLEDYKAKTAEVAQKSRELEAKATNIEADVKAHYADQLEQATNAFAEFDPVLVEARKINWDQLKATDPAAYVQASDAVNQRLGLLQEMQQKVATVRQEAQQTQQAREQQERAQRFDLAADKIVEAMPELADEAKFQSFATDAIGYLKGEGFDGNEIAEVLDHRVLTLADKARRWDAYQAAQRSLPQKKVVQKSAVKPLTTDGEGSRAPARRSPPSNAPRDRKVQWAVNQMLQEE
jgi:hypothetical protein